MSDCDCEEVLVAVTLCVTRLVEEIELVTNCEAELLNVLNTVAGADTVADVDNDPVGVPLRHSDALPVSDACDGLPDSV